MTWSDPIVDEVRRVREAYAARFNYDLSAIFQDLKEQERKSGHIFVDGIARPALQSQEGRPTKAADSEAPDSIEG